MASAMRGRSTSFNDGAPEYGRWERNETEAFNKYWDSPERVQRGKERKAAWDAMDPNEARSIRRARRKQLKAERLRNSDPETAQRMREGAGRVRGRLAEYRAGKSSSASTNSAAPRNTSETLSAASHLDEASGETNQYGDPIDTVYAGGSPTFNESTQRWQDYTGADGTVTKAKQPSKNFRKAGQAIVPNLPEQELNGGISNPLSFNLNW